MSQFSQSPELTGAEHDAGADTKSLEKTFVDGAITLLETGLKSAEADGEKLVPEFEQGVITTAERAVPPYMSGIIATIAGVGGSTVAKLNLSLDATAEAHLAIGIAQLKSLQVHLGG